MSTNQLYKISIRQISDLMIDNEAILYLDSNNIGITINVNKKDPVKSTERVLKLFDGKTHNIAFYKKFFGVIGAKKVKEDKIVVEDTFVNETHTFEANYNFVESIRAFNVFLVDEVAFSYRGNPITEVKDFLMYVDIFDNDSKQDQFWEDPLFTISLYPKNLCIKEILDNIKGK